MKIVDVNILVYVVNKSAPQHKKVFEWWEKAINGDEPLGLTWTALTGYFRVATHPSVFSEPQSPEDAIRQIDQWLDHPNTRQITEREGHWATLKQVILDANVIGSLTTDAHLAAIAISRGATAVSCDTDFARFPHLRWENPLA